MFAMPSHALEALRSALVRVENDEIASKILEGRDKVYERFGGLFRVEHIPQLTAEEFKAFLSLRNNRHWSGLHRHASRICADMNALRRGLLTLLDEGRPVGVRIDETLEMVQGMGRAIATAILHVSHPNQYGVWNGTSEGAMRTMGLWPQFERGLSVGRQYEQINVLLRRLAAELGTDLWTLDILWWLANKEVPDDKAEDANHGAPPAETPQGYVFGLERQLHDFLLNNWERLDLAKTWEIYREPGAEELGYEYQTGVGRIDLLARKRDGRGWLVIEIKRGRSSDAVVGQILRYMGWVKQHLAGPGESVRGLVISRDADPQLHYALASVPNIELRVYEIDFRLKPIA